MSHKHKEILKKDDLTQAVVIADSFNDEFLPLSSDIPLALFPLLNRPLIDYTLEFLSLGGIDETYLFCCSHTESIKSYINQSIKDGSNWSLMMRVNVIVSESCHSFGDCLRDLDRKGLLRGNFVLLEPGVLSNIRLQPLLKKHTEISNKDKGAAMTVIFQENGLNQLGNDPQDEVIIAAHKQRLLFHKKMGKEPERKIVFPMEIFLENSDVLLHHNLKDTHISICSSSVLPLFSDNFDFQTKDDFIKGLLMNEEIMGSTVYHHILKGSNFGGAVSNWRMYQDLSNELQNKWIYPLHPPAINKQIKHNLIGQNASIKDNKNITKSVLGDSVWIGKNVKIEESVILSSCRIENDATVINSIIGQNCQIKSKSKIINSVLGCGVIVENDKTVEDLLVQSMEPPDCEAQDKLGKHAFKLNVDDITGLSRASAEAVSDGETDPFSESDEEDLSHTQSPLPDDTTLFFTEVIDSLTRGFEDQLHCENLILEINSSRYAYNVTVKEVNFNVLKAIFHMSLRLPIGPQYFAQFVRLLSYFVPILKNYIRNESAMGDTLQAVEDVAISNENVSEKWIMFVLKWFYDKDYVSEDAILKWSQSLDQKSRFYASVKPFVEWLEEAEEASSSDEE